MSKPTATEVDELVTSLESTGRVPARRPMALWPSLGEAAFHGLAGEIVRTIEPHSEADPAGLLLSTLSAFGAHVGPAPHATADGAPHPARLFVMLVGRTSRARKGSAQAQIARNLEAADPSFASERVFGGLASGEGLIAALEEIGADSGDRRALVFEPELARLLKAGSREGNTLSQIVRQSWDSGHLRVMTRHNPLRVDGAHLCLIGHITADELRRNLTETEIAAGFANRFLVACVKRSKRLPDGGSLSGAATEAMGARLRRAADKARTLGNLTRNHEASKLWAEIYEAIDDDAEGLFGAVTARAEAQMLRLSVAYALLDGTSTIEMPHVEAAQAVWEYCEQSAAYVFGETRGDPVADKILDRLRQVSPKGLTRVQVRDLFSNHTTAARIDTAIEGLTDAEMVTSESESTGGRPRTVIRSVDSSTCAESSESAESNGGLEVTAHKTLSAQSDLASDPDAGWIYNAPIEPCELCSDACSCRSPAGQCVHRSCWHKAGGRQ